MTNTYLKVNKHYIGLIIGILFLELLYWEELIMMKIIMEFKTYLMKNRLYLINKQVKI